MNQAAMGRFPWHSGGYIDAGVAFQKEIHSGEDYQACGTEREAFQSRRQAGSLSSEMKRLPMGKLRLAFIPAHWSITMLPVLASSTTRSTKLPACSAAVQAKCSLQARPSVSPVWTICMKKAKLPTTQLNSVCPPAGLLLAAAERRYAAQQRPESNLTNYADACNIEGNPVRRQWIVRK